MQNRIKLLKKFEIYTHLFWLYNKCMTPSPLLLNFLNGSLERASKTDLNTILLHINKIFAPKEPSAGLFAGKGITRVVSRAGPSDLNKIF